MYPDDILPGVDLYTIMLCAGVLAAMLIFRFFSDRRGFSTRLNNFVLAEGVVAVILGYGSAVLFQAVYNAIESGIFTLDSSTGATFYGGFIGGAAVFLIIYFGVGYFVFRDGENVRRVEEVTSICAAAVCAAHSLGRIGCLFAGCCYGRVTDSVFSVYNAYLDARVVPVQLYESLFLAALFGFLCFRLVKKKDKCLPIYLISYGIWRFFVEYLRTDDRGGSPVSFLTPSQLTALLLIAVGAVLIAVSYFIGKRKNKEPRKNGEDK